MSVGRVLSLHRYALKSVGGESLPAVDVDRRGLVADRRWAVVTADGGLGSGKTTRRFRRVDGLLRLGSRLDDEGRLLVRLPDGEEVPGDDPATEERLSGLLGRPVTVREETTVPHHDDCPVHVVTTASLRALGRLVGQDVDPRRVRANVLVDVDGDDFVEDAWQGRRLAVGEVLLAVGPGMPRCVMVDAPQPGLPAGRHLKALAGHDLELGVMADVLTTGTLRVGDEVRLT